MKKRYIEQINSGSFKFREGPNTTFFLVKEPIQPRFYSCIDQNILLSGDEERALFKNIFSNVESTTYISEKTREMLYKEIPPFSSNIQNETKNIASITEDLSGVARQLDARIQKGYAPLDIDIRNIDKSKMSHNKDELQCIALWEYNRSIPEINKLKLMSPLNIWCRYNPIKNVFHLPDTPKNLQDSLNKALLCIIYRLYVGQYPWEEWRDFSRKVKLQANVNKFPRRLHSKSEGRLIFYFQQVMYDANSQINKYNPRVREQFFNHLKAKLGPSATVFLSYWKQSNVQPTNCVKLLQKIKKKSAEIAENHIPLEKTSSQESKEESFGYSCKNFKPGRYTASQIAENILQRPHAKHQIHFRGKEWIRAQDHPNIQLWMEKLKKRRKEAQQASVQTSNTAKGIQNIVSGASRNTQLFPDPRKQKTQTNRQNIEHQIPHVVDKKSDFFSKKKTPVRTESPRTTQAIEKEKNDFFGQSKKTTQQHLEEINTETDFFTKKKKPVQHDTPPPQEKSDINTDFFTKKTAPKKSSFESSQKHCLHKLKDIFQQYPTAQIESSLDEDEQYLCLELSKMIKNIELPNVTSPNEATETSWFENTLYPLLDLSALLYSKVATKSYNQEIDENFSLQIENLLFTELPVLFEEYQWFKAVIMIPFKTEVDFTRNDYQIVGSFPMYDSNLRDRVHSIQNYGLNDFQTGKSIRKILIYTCS